MVSASREIAAGPGPIFELIADPAQQPPWAGSPPWPKDPIDHGMGASIRFALVTDRSYCERSGLRGAADADPGPVQVA